MNTTKMDLCRRILEKTENSLKIKDVQTVLDLCFEEILEVMSEGERIEIRGFGCFCLKNRKARVGRNPRTGAVVPISEDKTPYLKFSKDAKAKIKNSIYRK